jgi:hypothetical protein
MAIRSGFGTKGRTMRVRTVLLGRIALFALVLHVGVAIGRGARQPVVVVQPAPVVTETKRPQRMVDPTPELLPAVASDLPDIGTKEFNIRVREMGLDSGEVAKFAQMMRTQDLAVFRK